MFTHPRVASSSRVSRSWMRQAPSPSSRVTFSCGISPWPPCRALIINGASNREGLRGSFFMQTTCVVIKNVGDALCLGMVRPLRRRAGRYRRTWPYRSNNIVETRAEFCCVARRHVTDTPPTSPKFIPRAVKCLSDSDSHLLLHYKCIK